MTAQRKAHALRYIEAQLDNGYIDLGINDQDELKIIREAINLLKAIDAFNSIGCTSFMIPPKQLKEPEEELNE